MHMKKKKHREEEDKEKGLNDQIITSWNTYFMINIYNMKIYGYPSILLPHSNYWLRHHNVLNSIICMPNTKFLSCLIAKTYFDNYS